MTAEAIARLRHEVTKVNETWCEDVRAADLRALLDAHTALEAAHAEALDALLALRASYVADGGDRTDPGLQIASRVLAKAGRR